MLEQGLTAYGIIPAVGNLHGCWGSVHEVGLVELGGSENGRRQSN